MKNVLIDAGPLVAILDQSDTHHQICKKAFKSFEDPLATVWPAVTKAMYLLVFSWKTQEALWEMLSCGAVAILPPEVSDLPRMRELMEKFKDLPMDLADASLVRVAERERIQSIFTLDRRDFKLYRPTGIGYFTIIP